MMPATWRKSGNRGNSGDNVWEPSNLLKSKAGNHGYCGNRENSIFKNTLQAPTEKRLRDRETYRFP